MKQVDLKNQKYENRVLSILEALSVKSGLSEFHRGLQKERFLKQVFKHT